MNTRVTSRFTKPGHLVEITFDTGIIVTISSRSTITWNGYTWLAYNLRVQGLTADGRAGQSGTLIVTSVATEFLSLLLNYGIADKRIRVWIFDADALAVADPVIIYDGFGDDVSVDNKKVTLRLSPGTMSFAPRRYMNAANGFSWLPLRGQVLQWGGEVYEIE